jgi:uncharacterized lipoprotein YajG
MFQSRHVHTRIAIVLAALALLTACASPTPVNRLALPPVTLIQGQLSALDAQGFVLTDASGAIAVAAAVPKNKQGLLSSGQTVKVYGNLRSGAVKVFDGYVVQIPSGENIIITAPSPHLGFILQTRFE